MGSYSVLSIGRWQFQWKWFVPRFAAFVFTENDFYVDRSIEDEDVIVSMAYKTSRKQALHNLEAAGYTMEFLADIYDTFKETVDEALYEALRVRFDDMPEHVSMSEEEIASQIKAHLSKQGVRNPLSDLRDYVEVLNRCEGLHPSDTNVRITVGKRPVSIPADVFQRFQEDSLDHGFWVDGAWIFPPSVVRVGLLLSDERNYEEVPDVLFLMLTRALLEASPPDWNVVLELDDLFDTPEDAESVFASLPLELAQKVHLYNRMFKVLMQTETEARRRYTKAQVRSMLSQLSYVVTPQEKGELLEDMVASLFGGEPDLKVVERRFSTGDEEIDLIIRNDVNRPFWMGLASPLVFVECKNWSTSVGVAELRNFEGKMLNHPLSRLGLFIAPGGFSREWTSALLRLSRSPYMVVPIALEDLKAYAYGEMSVVDWLETLICRLI